jgi:hypothetical protein
MLVALTGAAATTGCGEDTPGLDGASLCCTDFEVGADLSGVNFGMDAEMEGQFKVFAQAMADLSGVAAATLGDIEVACTNIATDMGATKEQLAAENAKSGGAKVQGLCTLAAARIDAYFGASGEFSGEGSLEINFDPPRCSASVSASANCSAQCNASVGCECDVEANPPTCEGGKMQVSCSGSCEGSANASVACEGKCEGSCSGSCKADVGARVECQGKCEGTCSANADGSGNGVQADGSCNGHCDGTCEIAADANIECSGSCQGSCDAACTASAGATVKCDGECSGTAEPLKCEGGTLKASCECDAAADCNANCEASASAKAECHPPSVSVVFAANANASIDAAGQAQLNAAIASLKANLPNILIAVKARGQAFLDGLDASLDAGMRIGGNVGNLSGKAVVCAPAILSAGATAFANMDASIKASLSVTAALDI